MDTDLQQALSAAEIEDLKTQARQSACRFRPSIALCDTLTLSRVDALWIAIARDEFVYGVKWPDSHNVTTAWITFRDAFRQAWCTPGQVTWRPGGLNEGERASIENEPHFFLRLVRVEQLAFEPTGPHRVCGQVCIVPYGMAPTLAIAQTPPTDDIELAKRWTEQLYEPYGAARTEMLFLSARMEHSRR